MACIEFCIKMNYYIIITLNCISCNVVAIKHIITSNFYLLYRTKIVSLIINVVPNDFPLHNPKHYNEDDKMKNVIIIRVFSCYSSPHRGVKFL